MRLRPSARFPQALTARLDIYPLHLHREVDASLLPCGFAAPLQVSDRSAVRRLEKAVGTYWLDRRFQVSCSCRVVSCGQFPGRSRFPSKTSASGMDSLAPPRIRIALLDSGHVVPSTLNPLLGICARS